MRIRTSPEEEARLADQAKSFPVTRLPYYGPSRDNKWGKLTEEMHMENHAEVVERSNKARARTKAIAQPKLPLLQRIRSIDVGEVIDAQNAVQTSDSPATS
jgi:hypothetical protein